MCEKKRCRWAAGSEEMIRYHDQEWGTPQHDDAKLFELFLLEGFQAGLSWAIVLKKREAFRRALDGFDAEKIAARKRFSPFCRTKASSAANASCARP